MKHYLIDTNVVIDILTDRIGSEEACAILDGAERGEYILHLCSLSVTNIYYSLRKILTHEERINVLNEICEVIEVLTVDKQVIINALHSGWKDFEDSVQYHCAKANPLISGIITRNVKDFQLSDIEVLDSLTFSFNH